MLKTLDNILNDLSKHKRNKDELLILYINERLDKSLHTYYSSLISSVNYLKYRNCKNVMDKMNR